MNKVPVILLVEDDVWLAELYTDALTHGLKCVVKSAPSAERALALLDTITVDLIVLDMFLPDHNGIEFLHEIASYEDSSHVPVMVLSGVAEQDFTLPKNRWQHYGVVSYLYKPHTKPADLLKAIKDQLHSVQFEHETAN